ncbi:MAG TPA: universal stress protein [Nitrospirota bacterium]|nr:universal stress protein [Nitrospirota bacterium]
MSAEPICPTSKLDKILVTTDRSSFSEGAIREALNFSNKCNSHLYVISVLEPNPDYETIGAGIYEKEERQAAEYLETIHARAVKEGISFCETKLLFGQDPYRLIVKEAGEKNVDMIIIGRRGRSGIMKMLMGSVTAKVIGHAPCKVLVVPRAARIECGNILVATDGSEHSLAAAEAAIGIARQCGSSIIAVSVKDVETETADTGACVNAVADMARKANVPVSTETPRGRAHAVIVEMAGGRGVDLIVMGAHGKTDLRHLVMGSTAERVIGLANCAVMVVPARAA